MTRTLRTVALLVANPALSSILSSTLAASPSLRVRAFATPLALCTYLRITPADIVVMDLDGTIGDPFALAARLRHQSGAPANLQVLGLASGLADDARAAARHHGLDEVIIKPMSPLYLVERVMARLARPSLPVRSAAPRHVEDWTRYGSNVVSLFGHRPSPDLQPH